MSSVHRLLRLNGITTNPADTIFYYYKKALFVNLCSHMKTLAKHRLFLFTFCMRRKHCRHTVIRDLRSVVKVLYALREKQPGIHLTLAIKYINAAIRWLEK